MHCYKDFIHNILQHRENRSLVINIAGNYLIKGGAMLVSLLTMPAYMRYFESQTVLGMWFTLIQLLNWIMMLDFGIGGGLRNKIIAPLQSGRTERVTELVTAAYFSVSAIVIAFIVSQHFIVEAIDWYPVLGISPESISRNVLTKTVHILIVGICIRFFSVLVSHILYALQRAVMPNIIILLSNVSIMVYLMLAQPTGSETDIIKLAYINSIAINLPALIATIWVFATALKGMGVRIRAFRMDTAKELLGTGGILFYLQIIIMVLFNVKELYISWFVNVAAVVEYQVYYKLIGTVGGLFSLALAPVWSAVTKALVEGRLQWIKKLYQRGMRWIGLFGAAQLLLVAAMPWIVKIWLGEGAVSVSRIYGLIFCIYNIVYMWTTLNYNFACGMGRTRVISIQITIAGVLNLLLTMFGSHIYCSWIIVIIATMISAIPCMIFVQRDIFMALDTKQLKER